MGNVKKTILLLRLAKVKWHSKANSVNLPALATPPHEPLIHFSHEGAPSLWFMPKCKVMH